MTERITAYARKGQWDKYKEAIKKRWKAYVKESQPQSGGDEGLPEGEALMLMANRLPIELWIEPEIWTAAREKAGQDARLKATIRLLLKMWVDGVVDPWA